MTYKIKRAIFWSMRHLGHVRAMLGSSLKDKWFGNWSLIYLLPRKPSAEQQAEWPSLSVREGKKAKTSCLHHKFKFLYSKTSQPNICSWMWKTGSHYQGHLAIQGRETSLEQGNQKYGDWLGAKTSGVGDEDEKQGLSKEPSWSWAQMPQNWRQAFREQYKMPWREKYVIHSILDKREHSTVPAHTTWWPCVGSWTRVSESFMSYSILP